MLGLRGRRNLDAGEVEVSDPGVRAALRLRSLRLIGLAALLTAAAAVPLFLL
jgi:hypothetical protein